jgi:Leucine-rich repeat (LRR) protein
MARSDKQKKAQAAWDRIEALGGHGVWESEMVVVSFGETKVTDEDLALFRDFSFVQVLDLSDTGISDAGLAHLEHLPALEELIVTNTKISDKALKEFQRTRPAVKITKGPPPKDTINPFTGKPF